MTQAPDKRRGFGMSASCRNARFALRCTLHSECTSPAGRGGSSWCLPSYQLISKRFARCPVAQALSGAWRSTADTSSSSNEVSAATQQCGHIGVALSRSKIITSFAALTRPHWGHGRCSFPVAERAAIVDLGRPVVNARFHRKNPVARGAGIAWFPLSAAFGQEAGQLR